MTEPGSAVGVAAAELVASRHLRPAVPVMAMADPSVVPVVDNGEELTMVEPGLRLSYLASYHALGLDGAVQVAHLRRSVVAALDDVVQSLPDGFGLAVFDAWRSMRTVTDLFTRATLADPTLPSGYVADPNDSALVPPHTTGGAVDLTVTFDGAPLLLGTPFDHFARDAWTATSEQTDLGCRHLRRLLYWAMANAGFVNYPREWWHYSLGDQVWAVQTGRPQAYFGGTEPAT